jgi:hypothetical protein
MKSKSRKKLAAAEARRSHMRDPETFSSPSPDTNSTLDEKSQLLELTLGIEPPTQPPPPPPLLSDKMASQSSTFDLSPLSMSASSSTNKSDFHQLTNEPKTTPTRPLGRPPKKVTFQSKTAADSNTTPPIKATKATKTKKTTTATTAPTVSCDEPKVLVPSWRIVPFKRSYSMAGTELLNPEIFLKRHQKHENGELKIKRWDIQQQMRAEAARLKLLKTTSTKKKPNSKSETQTIPLLLDSHSDTTTTSTTTNDHIHYKTNDQINLNDLEFVEIVSEEEINSVKMPLDQVAEASNVNMQQQERPAIVSNQPTTPPPPPPPPLPPLSPTLFVQIQKEPLSESTCLNIIATTPTKNIKLKAITDPENCNKENNTQAAAAAIIKRIRSKSLCEVIEYCKNSNSLKNLNPICEIVKKIDLVDDDAVLNSISLKRKSPSKLYQSPECKRKRLNDHE